MIVLTACLGLALVLALALALTLQVRLLRILAEEHARKEAAERSSGAPLPSPAPMDVATAVAALRVLVEELDRHGIAVPDSAPESPFESDDPPATESPRPPDPGPASRQRPLPVGFDPPGSAPSLPALPAIVAARLGPRPDPGASRSRAEVAHVPRAAPTLPSMKAFRDDSPPVGKRRG